MTQSPKWLTTLLRLREHHRDVARQSLAQYLSVEKSLEALQTQVLSDLAGDAIESLPDNAPRRLDLDRLKNQRRDRDDLNRQLHSLNQQRAEANFVLRQSQAELTSKTSEVDVLLKLLDRNRHAQAQSDRRIEEQAALDSALSLCNRPLGG